VRSRNESGDVKKLDRNGSAAGYAGAVVGFTSFGEVEALAGAFDLEIANCALRVDCCESGNLISRDLFAFKYHLAYGKLPADSIVSLLKINRGVALRGYIPTLEVASVKLFSVVLFPDEGLPTKPIKGSRGMVSAL
jgi:hypothetical protein